MRIDIIFQMMLMLLGHQMTARDIACKLSISTRTVYRYLTILDTSGIPIITKPGKHGGISILGSFKLGGLYFTPAEKLTLLSLMPYVPTQFMKKSLTEKLQLL